MLGLRPGKVLWGVVAVSCLLILTATFVMVGRPDSQPRIQPTNTINSQGRQQYAALYEAAWRQDDGRDGILVTATLLVPPARDALGKDTQRSSTEDQLWRSLKNVDAKTIPIVLTFDSVIGAVPDETIQKSLTLQILQGQKFDLKSWQPLIAPTRIVNTAQTTSSQIGLALFAAEQNIDWPALGAVTLDVTNIGRKKVRTFQWVEPKVLLEL